jgi:hypothetical protein
MDNERLGKNYIDLFHDCFEQSNMPETVEEKALWINKLFPAGRVVDIGGMWGCNGFYSFLASAGAKEVLLLDSLLTDRFSKIKQNFSNVRFIQIDFYQLMLAGKLSSLGDSNTADAAICYDVVLHQPEPIHFINNIFNSFGLKRVILANPVIKKSTNRSDLFFVPFSKIFNQDSSIRHSASLGDHGGWIWVFSHGFLLNCLKYLKLCVLEERLIRNWNWHKGLDYSLILAERR